MKGNRGTAGSLSKKIGKTNWRQSGKSGMRELSTGVRSQLESKGKPKPDCSK